jgi:hypothetical protein
MSLLRADKLLESTLGFDKSGIGQLRSVEYSKKYLWEVSFGGRGDDTLPPPAPFADFFPAIDLDMDEAILQEYGYEQYMSTYNVPHKTQAKEISLTFNDNDDNALFKWMSDWINIDILNHGHFISAILDDHIIVDKKNPNAVSVDSFGNSRKVKPLRKMSVSLLSSGRSKVLTRNFLVFPKGKLAFNGSQASAAQTYSMSFVVVSQLDDSINNDKAAFLDKLKAASVDLFGRFI